MFNNRRQTKDRIVIQKIKEIVNKENLHLSNYSLSLFQDNNSLEDTEIVLCNESEIESKESDYYFIEDFSPKDYEKMAKRIVLFCWNKTYPADSFFNIDLSKYELKEEVEFEGYSHDNISMKIYDRRYDYE